MACLCSKLEGFQVDQARSTRLNNFIATYHAPYNSKHRYWTGLLLIVRVIMYITASVTVSSNPQTLPLMTVMLVGGMFLLKSVLGIWVYRSLLVDNLDTVLLLNNYMYRSQFYS